MHALIDANVFVSVRTLDVVLTLAQCRLFELSWTDAIEDEAVRAVSRIRPDAEAATRHMLDGADRAFPFAKLHTPEPTVVYGLPDAGDEHVLNAALSCEADVIVTYNTKDFPDEVLVPLGLKAVHPDEFLTNAFLGQPEVVTEALRALVANKRRPPLTIQEEMSLLRRNHLERFASALENRLIG